MNKPKQKMTLEKLAVMVADGFEDVKNTLGADISVLKTDMSDVKLRLDYLAPKFEVRDLEKRVTRLEVKTGIRRNT